MARIRSFKLRWLHGQLGEITYEHTRTLIAHPGEMRWIPAVNIFRCERAFCVCVDLAGVRREEVELTIEPGRLVVRGVRGAPEPPVPNGPAVRVLAMEIDAGEFERELRLPADVAVEEASAEQENGLLWIHLPIS